MNTIKIYNENINYINNYGYLGFILIIARDENIYFEDIDKDSYEVDDEYLIKFIQKNIEYYKRKFELIETIEVSGIIINENLIDLISNIDNKKIFVTGFFENSELIMNLCNNENVYIKDISLNRLSIEQIETYINLKKNNKVLKKVYDVQIHKDRLVIDKELDDINLTINSIEDIKKITNLCHNNNEINKLNLNVKISDIDLLRRIGAFALYNEYLELNLNLNIDVKNIDINRIPVNKCDNCKWHINAYGLEFNEYYEFYNFNNFIKFLNNKIPKEASDIEKTVFLSNFIVNYFDYDDKTFGHKSADDNGNRIDTKMTDVIQLGSGVCRHYAKITECLFNYFDIKCEYIESYTRQYENALNNGDTIEYDENGRLINENFIPHAFNVVYLEGKPYWLDLTWCDFNSYGFVDDSNFLVSTHTFSKGNSGYIGHSDYIEIDNYHCENDYDREKIRTAIYHVALWDSEVTLEDINWLTSNGLGYLAQKADSLSPKKR